MRLITLEEHFVHPDVVATHDPVDRALLAPSSVPGLDEVGDMRIAGMDAAGRWRKVVTDAQITAD